MIKPMKTLRFSWLLMLLSTLLCTSAQAEQYKTLGDWDVHYIVINTSFLSPEIARAYGIQRSKYQALVNISVLQKDSHKAQSVAMTGTATNLLGTKKTLAFKEVKEGDAIYYLAVLPFDNLELYRFNINIVDGNENQTLKFQQKLYVD